MSKLTDLARIIGQDIKSLLAKNQDTGWRKVPSTSLSKGHVLIRRLGNICFINTGGGDYDSCQVAESERAKPKINLINVPMGYRSKVAVIEDVTNDGNSAAGLWILTSIADRSVLQIRNFPRDVTNYVRPQMLVYVTDDPFPTQPIGEAV